MPDTTTTEPTASDWRRAARELNPTGNEELPTALAIWMLLNIVPAIIVIVAWLLR